MIQLIGAMIIYLIFIYAYIKNAKHDSENGFHMIVLGNIFFFVCIGISAAIFHLLKVNVTILTVGLFMLICDVIMLIYMLHSHKKARLIWNWKDGISYAITFIFVAIIMFVKFGIRLKLNYADIDAPRYYQTAMNILGTGEVSGEYLSSLIDVLFIKLVQPFLEEVQCYKGMILSHVWKQVLCISMFQVLLSRIVKKNGWYQPILAIMFYSGFPLYNILYGTFIHATDGMIFIMLICYYAVRLQQDTITHLRGTTGVLLGVFGLLICYPFYFILIGLLFGLEILLWVKKNTKVMSQKLKVSLLLCVFTSIGFGGVFAYQRINGSLETLMVSISADGPTIKNPYMDFIFFIPILIVYAGILIKDKKECKIILRMNIGTLVFLCGWFYLYLHNFLSSYYYYKMYQVLWLFMWIMTGHAISILVGKNQYIYIGAYSVLCGFAFFTSILGTNEKLWNMKNEMFALDEREFSLCPMYAFNYSTLTGEQHEMLSDSEYGLYWYVTEYLDDVQVPMISSYSTAMQSHWYAGLTANERVNFNYQLGNSSLKDIFSSLDNCGDKYILIEKTDVVCMKYYEPVFSKLKVVVENEGGYILYKPNGTWTELLTNEVSVGLMELCNYVNAKLPEDCVMLNCESSMYNEIIFYGAFIGEESLSMVGKILPENFIPLTYQLNKDEIEYLVVLKESEMYQYNKEYFDSQDILFENEVGMVITNAGIGWMPSEQ